MSGERPWLLVVAGHDSSGGAGVDADREAAEAAGIECRVVVTAWTRQDAGGVRELGAVEPEAWLAEALALPEGPPSALKFGLLPGAPAVDAAALLVRGLRARLGQELPVVLDPVIVASSGTRFLETPALERLRAGLRTLGPVLTPNLPEAAELSGWSFEALRDDPEERIGAARCLLEAGARAVLLKGGHGEEDPVRDLVLMAGGAPIWVRHARVPGKGIRGSGCRYATAVAAKLALGRGGPEAAEWAGGWVASKVAGEG